MSSSLSRDQGQQQQATTTTMVKDAATVGGDYFDAPPLSPQEEIPVHINDDGGMNDPDDVATIVTGSKLPSDMDNDSRSSLLIEPQINNRMDDGTLMMEDPSPLLSIPPGFETTKSMMTTMTLLDKPIMSAMNGTGEPPRNPYPSYPTTSNNLFMFGQQNGDAAQLLSSSADDDWAPPRQDNGQRLDDVVDGSTTLINNNALPLLQQQQHEPSKVAVVDQTSSSSSSMSTINQSSSVSSSINKYWDPSSAKRSATTTSSTRRSFLLRQKQQAAAVPPLLQFEHNSFASAADRGGSQQAETTGAPLEAPQIPYNDVPAHELMITPNGGESRSSTTAQADHSLSNVLVFLVRLHDKAFMNDGDWLSTTKKLNKAYRDLMGAAFVANNGSDDLLTTLERLKYLQVDNQTRSKITWCKRAVAKMVANTSTAQQQMRPQATNVSGGCNRQGTSNSASAKNTASGAGKSTLFKGDSWTLADGTTRCFFVDTMPKLLAILASDEYLRAKNVHSGLDGANNKNRYAFVAIDAEGVPESLQLVQVATPDAVYVLDGQKLGQDVVCKALLPLLESSQIIKVLHDLHQDAVAFQTMGGISLASSLSPSVLDSQLVGEFLYGDFCIGFNPLLTKLEVPIHPSKGIVHARMKMQDDYWANRPLRKTDIEYAAMDVACLVRAMRKMQQVISSSDFDKLLAASTARVQGAIETGGLRSLCFDTRAGKYARHSAELMRAFRPDDGFFGKPLIVESEVEDVLNVLPDTFRTKLGPRQQQEDKDEPKLEGLEEEALLFVGLISNTNPPRAKPKPQVTPTPPQQSLPSIDLSRLTDIALDIGRRPHCWINGKRMFLTDEQDTVVKEEDIWHILEWLEEIGSDNRAGLNGKLHRFSVIRARGNVIAGVTIRLGRSITGNADLLMDYLLGSDKSILFLGEPGSGKTTVVREATRILADEHNVLVVDTSNEIAGDGMIPHHCIGLARRMMVPSLDEQSAVMVECVQNHTPSCMVIDEIGRPREVLAARTVKQRGVRIIASAHGDLRKLVKNKELRGLIGGVEQVVMGDAMAREEAKRREQTLQSDGMNIRVSTSKTKSQRASEPTFDVIVEVRRGAFHEWRIVPDVARAVDEILDGRDYRAEVRLRDPETGHMYLDFIRN